MHVVQDNLPEVIPVELRCLDWQESSTLFGKLVEPEIPD